MGESARLRSARFSWSDTAADLNAILDAAVGDGREANTGREDRFQQLLDARPS
jgi:hypothetical protein